MGIAKSQKHKRPTSNLIHLQKRLKKHKKSPILADTEATAIEGILANPQLMQLKSAGNEAKGNLQDKELTNFKNMFSQYIQERKHFNTPPLIHPLSLKSFALKIKPDPLLGQHK